MTLPPALVEVPDAIKMAPVSAVTVTAGAPVVPTAPSTAPVSMVPPAFWFTLSPLMVITPVEEMTSPFTSTAPVSVVSVMSLPWAVTVPPTVMPVPAAAEMSPLKLVTSTRIMLATAV